MSSYAFGLNRSRQAVTGECLMVLPAVAGMNGLWEAEKREEVTDLRLGSNVEFLDLCEELRRSWGIHFDGAPRAVYQIRPMYSAGLQNGFVFFVDHVREFHPLADFPLGSMLRVVTLGDVSRPHLKLVQPSTA